MQDDDIPERAATQRSKTTSQKRASVKRATAKKGGAPKAAAKKRAAKKARAGGAARKAATAPASPRSAGPAGRRYDFVLLGATGYTGGLTAEYLAERAPQGARWAIAGRDARKLADVRAHLERVNPTAEAVDCVEVDIKDSAALRRLARDTRVLATTVGPYVLHGEPVVAACAAEGTHYLDLTGEPEFVDTMWLRHHKTAQQTGAKIVHCCGFDSIPHDLGALFTAQQLPAEAPKRIEGYVRAGGTFSGGTFHSALLAFSRLRATAAAHRERARRETVTTARSVRGEMMRPRFDKRLDTWVLPFPSVDPQIVMRSARALPVYGPTFRYGHYVQIREWYNVAKLLAGVSTLMAAAQLPPARRWLMGRKPAGQGPSDEQRRRGWFRVRFFGEGGGRSVIVDVTGGDPGYGETARMLGESVLCMAFDALPEVAGQTTPAVAMGDALRQRLDAIGIRFSLVESK
ncbi:MAG: saccharopine dehydrogenase NADP-binding domain-containing protein [Algiphilus sp.]|uniref:saccharopine dehydrogenase family protein n=1 Tax=Algiphilus sp. TaxID=1872431 RepID=UPI0025BA43A6|nr:saccharopine dehydrogenase NADP-binding domain-containing protein [Algiphilus sp.]MCI5104475.1 saccharopine dehydrogenase NADP-binding domain-containing protein [Algiphilus sp.]